MSETAAEPGQVRHNRNVVADFDFAWQKNLDAVEGRIDARCNFAHMQQQRRSLHQCQYRLYAVHASGINLQNKAFCTVLCTLFFYCSAALPVSNVASSSSLSIASQAKARNVRSGSLEEHRKENAERAKALEARSQENQQMLGVSIVKLKLRSLLLRKSLDEAILMRSLEAFMSHLEQNPQDAKVTYLTAFHLKAEWMPPKSSKRRIVVCKFNNELEFAQRANAGIKLDRIGRGPLEPSWEGRGDRQPLSKSCCGWGHAKYRHIKHFEQKCRHFKRL